MYKTGINVNILPTETSKTRTKSQSIPVYVGFAPIHQLENYDHAVNKPILINSFSEAVRLIGYNNDWGNYTLCEPIYAHFGGDDIVAPIVVINTIDPTKSQKEEESTTVTFENGVGILKGAKDIILNTINIDDKTKGTDYITKFNSDGDSITITALPEKTLNSSTTVKYKKLKTEDLKKENIIGTYNSDGNSTGIYTCEYIYDELNVVPTLLVVPKYSEDKQVVEVMLKQLDNLGGYFDFYAYVDLPATDSDNDTPTKAIQKKKENNLDDYRVTLCYPKYKIKDKIFHLSVIRAKEAQKLDSTTEIPAKAPSNKPIPSGIPVSDTGKLIRITKQQYETLDANGISTVAKFDGIMRTWGITTAKYDYTKDQEIDPRQKQEMRVRVIRAIANLFKIKYFDKLHQPYTRGQGELILNTFQTFLNGQVKAGNLLSATIRQKETDEQEKELLGRFYFDLQTLGGVVIESIDLDIIWDNNGINIIYGGV